MKRSLLVLVMVLFAGVLATGCKSKENCPAYGYNSNQTQAQQS